MRIWDIHPGYLNRQSLLGEHRELHGIVSIIKNNKKGYSRHPETLRWVNHGWAIKQRHKLLVAEMSLRGYKDSSPVNLRANKHHWPDTFIDQPYRQLEILKGKYSNKEPGRIPLPNTARMLWHHHKFSVLARGGKYYSQCEKRISGDTTEQDFRDLTDQLTLILRIQPSPGGIENSLRTMWRWASCTHPEETITMKSASPKKILTELQRIGRGDGEPELIISTALSELAGWMAR